MSWITRCPDCDTVYKVASEQLQQAHGWLRCGTCQHVFDSTGRVVAADAIPTLSDRVNVGPPQLGRVDLERLLHKESPAPAMPLPVAPAVSPPAAAEPAPSPIAAFEEALQSFKVPDMPPAAPALDEDALTEDAAPSPPAPVPQADVQGPTSRMAVVLVWLLGLTLLLQVLLAARPAMLMHWPQWARVVSQWCGTATCRAQWQPPLSLWTLQAQSFALDDGAASRLTWSLRHSAPVALSVPDLELSLLNAQGQTVSAQRLTGLMTSAPYVLGAGQTWQGSLRVGQPLDAQVRRAQLRLIPR